MSYAERENWVRLVATIAMLAVYIPSVVIPAVAHAPTGGDWLWAMVWAIAASSGAVIIGTIVWNLAAGVRRGSDTRADERDTSIEHIAGRVGQAFLVIAAIVAIILCAGMAAPFWIAHTLFLGFAVSALVSTATILVLHRVGTI